MVWSMFIAVVLMLVLIPHKAQELAEDERLERTEWARQTDAYERAAWTLQEWAWADYEQGKLDTIVDGTVSWWTDTSSTGATRWNIDLAHAPQARRREGGGRMIHLANLAEGDLIAPGRRPAVQWKEPTGGCVAPAGTLRERRGCGHTGVLGRGSEPQDSLPEPRLRRGPGTTVLGVERATAYGTRGLVVTIVGQGADGTTACPAIPKGHRAGQAVRCDALPARPFGCPLIPCERRRPGLTPGTDEAQSAWVRDRERLDPKEVPSAERGGMGRFRIGMVEAASNGDGARALASPPWAATAGVKKVRRAPGEDLRCALRTRYGVDDGDPRGHAWPHALPLNAAC